MDKKKDNTGLSALEVFGQTLTFSSICCTSWTKAVTHRSTKWKYWSLYLIMKSNVSYIGADRPLKSNKTRFHAGAESLCPHFLTLCVKGLLLSTPRFKEQKKDMETKQTWWSGVCVEMWSLKVWKKNYFPFNMSYP